MPALLDSPNVPCVGATRRSPQLRHQPVPSLAGAVAVTLRLVRVHLAHLFEEIPRVRPRNVGRARTIAIPLLRPPGHGRLLHALRHGKKVRDKFLKGKPGAATGLPPSLVNARVPAHASPGPCRY